VSAVDDAWQAALATEHEAVFGYGVLGPRLNSGELRSLARACQDAHASLRDSTTAAMAAAGRTPVAAQADYPSVYAATSAPTALRVAVALEVAAAAAWRYLYAQAASDPSRETLRAPAQAALTSAAVRATRWRVGAGEVSATVPFPGI
jgi:hypothetical protein